MKALADAGVGAVVLPSLYEEQVNAEELYELEVTEPFEDAHGEAHGYFPVLPESALPGATSRYLSLIEQAVRAVDIPVIASLNGSSLGGWTDFARQIEAAGAAALELNIYFVPGDPHTSGRTVEDRHVEILRQVKSAVSLPVAVKLSPHFSSTGEMALRLDEAGADGLVLFNRFLHPDVDPESLVVAPGAGLSTPEEARLARSWIAILNGHVRASLAATTGVENARDVAAYLLAGADVVMTASALLRHGHRARGSAARRAHRMAAAQGFRLGRPTRGHGSRCRPTSTPTPTSEPATSPPWTPPGGRTASSTTPEPMHPDVVGTGIRPSVISATIPWSGHPTACRDRPLAGQRPTPTPCQH